MAQNMPVGEASPPKAYPSNYFFYGSLMDPTRISGVLQLDTNPAFVPATVMGYRLMLWGPYPALIPLIGETVSGLMYEVQTEEDAQSLQRYETNNYAPQDCSIKLEDGTVKDGQTFVWAGDRSDLREGAFDLKAWQTGEAKARELEQQDAQRFALKAHKPSVMARKMRSGRAITPLPPGTKTLIETFPRMHFVYDSQMDPTVLSHVLELTNTPELRPALVMGYRLMFWGRYPALVQESGEVTSGFAFEIQNFEDASRLERYNPEEMDLQGVDANESETRCYDPSKYQARICMIKFEDGTSVLASALVWDGDEAILKKRSS